MHQFNLPGFLFGLSRTLLALARTFESLQHLRNAVTEASRQTLREMAVSLVKSQAQKVLAPVNAPTPDRLSQLLNGPGDGARAVPPSRNLGPKFSPN